MSANTKAGPSKRSGAAPVLEVRGGIEVTQPNLMTFAIEVIARSRTDHAAPA